ncbi:STAS/SEC14 domain-containing protein [Grimontia sp. NTOU-MAR1]|uniref:STAS/SEC14 domain-containing protein n=1 Tax=Grimontia sp. NTOU-MAR1 TaxID=3111011 RepID=UPI002DBAF47A|nr:STAS/SEC14 domain-containing protein [Grimontia sp. NTOU-MAR1]WRW01075.1 STAS/SEC14 domain-containing protein [Grimontia sp. NTOU-MAR1]
MSQHGISIGLERVESDVYLSIKAMGKLTHGDYQQLVPMLNAALEQVEHPTVNVFFDATEFKGWELRAAWDDFKLGLRHGSNFAKVALYGTHEGQECAAKVGNWFISGEVKTFTEYDEAMAWLLD